MMPLCSVFGRSLVTFILLALPLSVRAAETRPLLDVAADGAEKRPTPEWGQAEQVSVTRSQDPAAPGLVVHVKPGPAGYPGVDVKPEGAANWDLSSFGHVQARLTNTGTKPGLFAVRVDNAGNWQDSPWSTEQAWLEPGKSATITVIFGHSYGQKPSYPLKPEAVVNILLFTDKADAEKSFRIESLVAGGPKGEKPALDPATVRINPANGVIFGPGTAPQVTVPIGWNLLKPWREARGEEPLPPAATKLGTQGGVQGTIAGNSARITFPADGGDQAAVFSPGTGSWDLTSFNEVRVKLKNDGATPITPAVQVFGSGATDAASSAKPLAPGEEREVIASFIPGVPAKLISDGTRTEWGPKAGTGSTFQSDNAWGIKITAKHQGEAVLRVQSITAGVGIAQMPDWVGKRPPTEGEWVKTFDDDFDGSAVDLKKWNIYGMNAWDKATHFSNDDLIVAGGMARLRYEKKHGLHNDSSKSQWGIAQAGDSRETDYASGYLDTYGKWTQRYGYFEARLKVPTTRGMWPAFWMMPDRGGADQPQWVRADTGKGGMELDIMEHLTRWGPYRYNIGMHWDGYGDQHKQTGAGPIYVQPDNDGFINAGMLWTPGLVVYYGNGREVARWECARVSTVPSNIIIENTQGGWDNCSLDESKLPADFVIDYVRVWQRKDLASPKDGYQAPGYDGPEPPVAPQKEKAAK